MEVWVGLRLFIFFKKGVKIVSTVGRANVEITADDKQARSKVNGFLNFLKGTTKIASGVVAGLSVFGVISSGFQKINDSTIGANASMEQYQNTLAVVLKDSKKAVETLAWAEKFAAQTPFEIPDIVEATVRLESYGLKAQEVLRTTGDMAAVMGKPLMQAVEAVADAQTGELERLKEFGITKQMIIDQASKMYEQEVVNAKGQIVDLAKFNDALFSLMEERFQGGMEIQSKTYNGLVSNVKDSFGTIARILSQPIFEKLKQGLDVTVPVLSAFVSVLKGDLKVASETLVDSFGEEKAYKIINFFRGMKNGIDNAKNAIKPFVQFIKGLFQLLIGNQTKGAKILEALGLSASEVQQIINSINLIKQIINGWIQNTINGFKTLGQFIIGIWQTIWPFLQPLLTQIVTFINEKVSQITQFWRENGEQIMQAVQNVFNFILGVIKFVMPIAMFIIQGIWTNIRNIIDGALNVILGLIKIFAGLLTGDWSKLWEGVKQLLEGAAQLIWNLVMVLLVGRILGALKGLVTSGKAIVNGFVNAIVKFFDWVAKNTNGIVSRMAQSIVNFFVNLYSNGSSVISNFVKKIVDFFKNLFTRAKDIWNSITYTIWWQVNTMKGRVGSIVQGLYNILSSIFKRIFSTAKGIFDDVKNAIITPITKAKDKVKEIIDKIKDFFSGLNLKIPKPSLPPLPHFKLEGKFSLSPPSVPKLSVDWYAKGAIFTKPTIFNTPFGLKGFGEAGPEAALPLTDRVLGGIGAGIARFIPSFERKINVIIHPQSINFDGREVSRVTWEYDVEFEKIYGNREKWFRG